jgi:hypothetical protein
VVHARIFFGGRWFTVGIFSEGVVYARIFFGGGWFRPGIFSEEGGLRQEFYGFLVLISVRG